MDKRRITRWFGVFLQRLRDFLWADVPPWRMGLSAAIGAAIAVTPTVGLQTVIVIAIVSLVRGNRGLALIASGIANPWTIPLIYYVDYRVGAALMGTPAWIGLPEHFSLGTLRELFMPAFVGSVVVGAACGAAVGAGVTVLCMMRRRVARRGGAAA